MNSFLIDIKLSDQFWVCGYGASIASAIRDLQKKLRPYAPKGHPPKEIWEDVIEWVLELRIDDKEPPIRVREGIHSSGFRVFVERNRCDDSL